MGILTWLRSTASGPVAWGAVLGSYVALLVIGAFAFSINGDERNRALNQFCFQQETLHLENITDLKRTYNYLVQLTPDQAGQSFNQAIIRFLPDTEEKAARDDAPPICDETYTTGVLGLGGSHEYGLEEPDPELPQRPKAIEKLPGGENLPPQKQLEESNLEN